VWRLARVEPGGDLVEARPTAVGSGAGDEWAQDGGPTVDLDDDPLRVDDVVGVVVGQVRQRHAEQSMDTLGRALVHGQAVHVCQPRRTRVHEGGP